MTASDPPTPAPVDENSLIAERREKLAAIRGRGIAFPNDFKPKHRAAELARKYGHLDNEALEPQAVAVSVAGRLMLKRVMGKASFATLQDASGRIQLRVSVDAIGEVDYGYFKHFDLGDIVGAEGTLFKTKTGELTVKVEQLRLLTKSLRPLPDKFHGLADAEDKYRQRYVDLITDEAARARFAARSKALSSIRRFMVEHGFMEVETPMLHPIPGGANAKPFVTHHNALDQQMFLRIAPELYLKRLIVGGFERVFEINRSFRNEGISVRHNPEFTMIEFYAAYWNHHDLMDFTEEVLRHAAREAAGSAKLTYAGREVDLDAKFARMTVREAIVRHGGVSDADAASAEALRARLKTPGRRRAGALEAARAAVRRVRGGGRGRALAADLHRRLSGRGLAAGARVRRRPVGDRALRALHHRTRIRQRLFRAQRRRGPGGALSRPGGQQGGRRRGGDVLRRRLHPRARDRHAADRRLRHRHRPAGDAAHRLGRASAT